MKKVFLSLSLFLFIFNSGILKAIEFEELSADNKFEIYKESCDQGQMANCYQEAIWYKKNQRLDTNEANKFRSTLESLKAKRKELRKDNPTAELEEDDSTNLKIAATSLGEEEQKRIAQSRYITLRDSACKGGETAACNEKEGKNDNTGSGLLYYTSLLLIGLAVFLIAKTIFQDEDTFQAQEKLDENNKLDEIAKHGIILRYSRPFFKRYFSPIVSGMKNKKGLKEKYRRTLAAAGLTSILTPEDFFAFKLFLILGFPIIFIIMKTFLEADWSLMLIPVLALVGFFYPDLWISGKIQQRQKDVIMSMPFCVDMLALSVEAGLDFVAAMAKVIEKAKVNALTEEFDTVIREIKIGSSRADALRNFAWRVDLIQISSFCATLIAADSVGASIGPILKSLAVEIRQKKSAEVEKAGATAATKILFPMMFLIIPSVLLIVFAPIVLEMIGAK
ncbi:MAG: type II secretion system F family protein [Bacteriovorax sp.]|nr:type II secretion system F family protein [Bacteriovorax sp.]